jgi:hypothetical protein
MDVSWKAEVTCDIDGCTATSQATLDIDHDHRGRVRIVEVAEDGWGTNCSYPHVRCPAHFDAYVNQRSSSAPSAADTHVHRTGQCNTSNCIEARRGDSRFYTVGGQLIPPTGR